MESKSSLKQYLLGASILLGLSILGFFIFKGFKTFSDKDRVVTVKGLAEIEIAANSSSMSINFAFSGDNLQEIIKQTETKKNAIVAYLNSLGFNNNDISVNNIDIEDKEIYYTTEWQNGQKVNVKVDRYRTSQSLSIKSKDIKETEGKADQIKLDLISKGLTSSVSTSYDFPELNSVKPKLIAESTKNARIAGEQFANDSKATLGKIKTASQGQISIAGTYSYNEDDGEGNSKPSYAYMQKARVVSTIVFFLE
jgi:uncharacterized protein